MIERISSHGARLQADARVDRALQSGVAADRVRLVVQVRELQPVRLRRRAEVEDPRRPGPREQRVALALVERPVADLRAGDVADVARLEQQERTEVGGLERLPGPVQPVGRGAARSRPGPPSRRRRCRVLGSSRPGTRPSSWACPPRVLGAATDHRIAPLYGSVAGCIIRRSLARVHGDRARVSVKHLSCPVRLHAPPLHQMLGGLNPDLARTKSRDSVAIRFTAGQSTWSNSP